MQFFIVISCEDGVCFYRNPIGSAPLEPGEQRCGALQRGPRRHRHTHRLPRHGACHIRSPNVVSRPEKCRPLALSYPSSTQARSMSPNVLSRKMSAIGTFLPSANPGTEHVSLYTRSPKLLGRIGTVLFIVHCTIGPQTFCPKNLGHWHCLTHRLPRHRACHFVHSVPKRFVPKKKLSAIGTILSIVYRGTEHVTLYVKSPNVSSIKCAFCTFSPKDFVPNLSGALKFISFSPQSLIGTLCEDWKSAHKNKTKTLFQR